MEQKIGFCTAADGVRIAYATLGKGPPLIKAPNWMTHLEYEWHSPVWRHWWEELAKDHTVVRFDQRGSGLSDWNVNNQSWRDWTSDLEAVVNAVGYDKFVLLGISQGGAIAVDYATKHPDNVSQLIIYGSYARGFLARGESKEVHEALLTLTRQRWGQDNPAYRQFFTTQFMPGGTIEQMSWFNELQRVSTSPENAARIIDETAYVDVLDLLPNVSVPTLVMHPRGDARVPFEQGRQFAALIPDSKFVALESDNHLLLESDPAWPVAISEVRKFLRVEQVLPDVLCEEQKASNFPNSLSQREVEVLRLVSTGMTNQEIADHLFISVGTVSTHVKNLLNKTNCSNRTEATAYAGRHGLV